MQPNASQDATVVRPKPPLKDENSASTQAMSRFDMPPRSITLAARMKNGIAISANLSMLPKSVWITMSSGRSLATRMATTELTSSTAKIGKLSASSTAASSVRISSIVVIYPGSVSFSAATAA